MRVVSLVPSATEILLAIGAIDCLAGISDDCLAIAGTQDIPVVSRAVIPAVVGSEASGSAVDAAVRSRLAAGEPLYEMDEALLATLDPDLVIGQDDCDVCAVPSAEVVATLTRTASSGAGRDSCRTVSVDPVDLADVLGSIRTIAAAVGRADAGDELAAELTARLHQIPTAAPATRPVVLVLDWADPPFVAGRWVPDIVSAAGGTVAGGVVAGDPSRQAELDALFPAEAMPDAVVVAPCGIDLPAAASAAVALRTRVGPGRARWLAVDGRQFFSRPGPGLVDGAEALAAWLRGESVSPGFGIEVG